MNFHRIQGLITQKQLHFYMLAINNNIQKILEVPFKIARKIIKYFGNFSIHYVQSL